MPTEQSRPCAPKPCSDCPFRRKSLPGWLGAYEGPEDFLAVHYHGEIPNPCHLTVNYDDPKWKDKLEAALPCAGHAIMFANDCKLPKTWKPTPVEQDHENVFSHPREFIAHHGTSKSDKVICGLCNKTTGFNQEDSFCHGCETNICGECDHNYDLMGQHEAEEHLDWPDEEEEW